MPKNVRDIKAEIERLKAKEKDGSITIEEASRLADLEDELKSFGGKQYQEGLRAMLDIKKRTKLPKR